MSSAAIFACSGPGAGEAIHLSEVIGFTNWAVSWGIGICGLVWLLVIRGGRLHRITWLAAVLAAHPGWWISARKGDCGHMLRGTSTVMTIVMAVVTLVAVSIRPARPDGSIRKLLLLGWRLLALLAFSAFVVIVVLVIWPTPPHDAITEEAYQQITTGMTEAEVQGILGPAGDYSSRGGYRVVEYRGDQFAERLRQYTVKTWRGDLGIIHVWFAKDNTVAEAHFLLLAPYPESLRVKARRWLGLEE